MRNELWIDSRNIQLLGNHIILDWHGKFTVSVPRFFLDWQKQYKV